ncbi:MAG: hypothetical protein K6B14_06370 [Lachnospiraceae bacterium]|nr:hypothetical protein [Lachnospiraceae bacterium]
MQECKKCKITIRGNKKCCPLCQGRLSGEPEYPAFPVIKRLPLTTDAVFRIALFLAVLAEITLGMICFVNGRWIHGIGIAMTVIVFGLADLMVALYFRGNLIKLITVETYIIMGALNYVNILIAGYMWAYAWVIPMMFIALMVTTLILARVGGLVLRDIMMYLIFDVIMGTLQVIPIRKGLNPNPWPAAISIALLFAIAAFVIIFRFNDLKTASAKYLNI